MERSQFNKSQTVEKTCVVVIGGGATGTGVLRDLAMRGIDAILLEQNDLAHGTSSRFHGLLHSGARYAVKDKESARECIEENKILRTIGRGSCVEDIEGWFVQLPQDDPTYVEKWVQACKDVDIPVNEVSLSEAFNLEPNINRKAVRVFSVPDGAIDGFRLVWANVQSAQSHGAKYYPYTRVDKILRESDRITGVEVYDLKIKQTRLITCEYIINAAGAWAGQIAGLAGLKVDVVTDKGTLIALNHRITSRVINRLRAPNDADIMVPHGTVAILGTTSLKVDNPDCLQSTRSEVEKILAIGKEMFPNIEEFRILRSFAGVRPLYQETAIAGEEADSGGRSVSRGFALLDHEERDGLKGLISMVGGKFTTYRLMAEQAVDLICRKVGSEEPCRTHLIPLLSNANQTELEKLKTYLPVPAAEKLAERLGFETEKILTKLEAQPNKAEILCECELVTLAEVEKVIEDNPTASLSDIRRKTRLGMGTCQGTFCSYRALGLMFSKGLIEEDKAKELLIDFLNQRWKGIHPVLWGQQIRETELTRNLYIGMLNLNEMDDVYEL